MQIVILILASLSMASLSRANESEFSLWLKENTISVDNVSAPLNPREIQLLDTVLADKRIVFLGEAAHWVHEKYDYRLRFLKYLIEKKGFRHLGMEMGFSDGARVNRFFQTGNHNDLSQVALYGYRGPSIRSRAPQNDCRTAAKPHPDFGRAFVSEELWFYAQLHSIGEAALPPDQRLHHFGFDVDTIPGGAYEDISADLKKYRANKRIAKFLKNVAPVTDESIYHEIARLESSLNLLLSAERSFRRIVGAKLQAKIHLSLRTLISSLRFQSLYLEKPCDEDEVTRWTHRLMQAMADRERMMFEIIRYKLEEIGPEEKIVLMGHNFHLSKSPANLWFTDASVPAQHALIMWPSIGEFVYRTLGEPIFSIWMIHNRGFQSNIDCGERECSISTRSDFLGSILSSAGKLFSLPLPNPLVGKATFLDQRLNFAANGGTYSANVAKNADLIYFVDEVSGLKERALKTRKDPHESPPDGSRCRN